MRKIPVSIYGATGLVGTKLLEMIKNHPWFEVTQLVGSEKSLGREIQGLKVESISSSPKAPLIFSCLSASVAHDVEADLAAKGYYVVSNASSHRFSPGIPLVIPEVNGEQVTSDHHLITNPNCSVTGIVLALKPLVDKFGITSLNVTTLQALSGAGKNHPTLIENVLPYIKGEEEKIEREPKKILQREFPIEATAFRVPVVDGHLANVTVSFENEASSTEIIDAWRQFSSIQLPSSPLKSIIYDEDTHAPQPQLHCMRGDGMSITIGRLREISRLKWRFVVLCHNLIRGAAGGALLNGELIASRSQLLAPSSPLLARK
ncbi:MAG: aspartate-semialdehyde dehydrogenase [Simkaniaceae bacterium]|nr:aspartate-semialdehyde dehydrogenase [Simkaniaceae bacterium]